MRLMYNPKTNEKWDRLIPQCIFRKDNVLVSDYIWKVIDECFEITSNEDVRSAVNMILEEKILLKGKPLKDSLSYEDMEEIFFYIDPFLLNI